MSSFLLSGCAAEPPELATVDYVDLDRFMGDWYVIANIPTFLEKGAHNAIETYALDDDGTIATTFKYRDGSFDGKLKEHNPRGFIKDTQSNALWGMRFIWPIKADYRVVYVESDYSITIIGRQKRDFVWLMARTPTIPDDKYFELVNRIEAMGYDITKVQRVPQKWDQQ
ncbi:MAG: lipocalin family protein [Pseudomonadota bacterium]